MFKIPKRHLKTTLSLIWTWGEFTTLPLNLKWSWTGRRRDQRRPFLDKRTVLLVCGLGLRLVFCPFSPMTKSQTMRPNQMGVDWSSGHRLPTFGWDVFDSFSQQLGPFLKDPWMVLVDNFPGIFQPNTIVYDFKTSHINFIWNEHVKLNETC